MVLKDHVHPTKEQLKDLSNSFPADQPVVMVNLLRFKQTTGRANESGREAYHRYSQRVQVFLQKAGAEVLWQGDVRLTVIGGPDDNPEGVLLVRYPSVQHFINMISDPGYQAITDDRTHALQYGGLFACSERFGFRQK